MTESIDSTGAKQRLNLWLMTEWQEECPLNYISYTPACTRQSCSQQIAWQVI